MLYVDSKTQVRTYVKRDISVPLKWDRLSLELETILCYYEVVSSFVLFLCSLTWKYSMPSVTKSWAEFQLLLLFLFH